MAWTLGVSQAALAADPAATQVRVATFDSGFGGFLTAKSIEQASRTILEKYHASITIRHYGDTLNSPYGEKTPQQIAQLGSAGVIKALDDGADTVFIACNTASTQYDAIEDAVEQTHPGRSKDVVSIIAASAVKAKEVIDRKLAGSNEASFAILATPATVRSMAYPRQLASLYGAALQEQGLEVFAQERWYTAKGDTVQSATQESRIELAGGKTIHLYQLAPGNWVELIERGANLAEKNRAISRDLGILFERMPQGARLDGIGYFCTHFPVLDYAIRLETHRRGRDAGSTEYIAQGPLMAAIFAAQVKARLHLRDRRPSPQVLDQLIAQSRASITLTGDNVDVTRALARTLFPGDPDPVIRQESFAPADSVVRQATPQ